MYISFQDENNAGEDAQSYVFPDIQVEPLHQQRLNKEEEMLDLEKQRKRKRTDQEDDIVKSVLNVYTNPNGVIE